MKKLILILVIFSTLSCSNDDDAVNQQDSDNFVDRWSLVSFSPGFAPTQNYENGDIIWDIQPDNNILVEFSVAPDDQIPLNESGTYPYEAVSNEILAIENVNYTIQTENQTLRLMNNPSSDGPMLIFERME